MSRNVDPIDSFLEWQTETVRENAFTCEPIRFEESDEWHFDEGRLRHKTGGWFYIAGVEADARDARLHNQQQIIIVQRQIAINGFLCRTGPNGAEVLFQGRVEPGNINGMQLAPTVQSTVSNYKRVHGGKPTQFVDEFLNPAPGSILLDELQSEEATRYLGKYNQNIVVNLPHKIDPPHGFRWYDLAAIRRFAVSSNILNTDARSVLSSFDWDYVAGANGPFDGHSGGSFGAELRTSYMQIQNDSAHATVELLTWLSHLRAHAGLHAQIIPIEKLRNWTNDRDSIHEIEPEHGFKVRQFRVVALNREVKSWDQPLLDSGNVGRLSLVFQKRDGVLQLLVKASYEIGYLEGVQLSASLSVPPGARRPSNDLTEEQLLEALSDPKLATVMHHCRQSEEGGRFYQEENDYEIVLLDPSVNLTASDDYRWLTLRQVRELIKIAGVFSIEFRGVFALLLAYL